MLFHAGSLAGFADLLMKGSHVLAPQKYTTALSMGPFSQGQTRIKV